MVNEKWFERNLPSLEHSITDCEQVVRFKGTGGDPVMEPTAPLEIVTLIQPLGTVVPNDVGAISDIRIVHW